MKMLVEKEPNPDSYFIDSCGTGGGNPEWYREGGWSYHEGDPADSRMKATASKRDIKLTSISRPLNRKDLETFDLIIAMDDSNRKTIMKAAQHWGDEYAKLAAEKTRMMM